jgi:uncharacterized protein (DUF433 family)
MELLDRISSVPDLMDGKAFVRGMRVTGSPIVGQAGRGRSVDEILADHPDLECEDVLQPLHYAASLAQGHVVGLVAV